jgi:hypothetical protein
VGKSGAALLLMLQRYGTTVEIIVYLSVGIES